MITTIEHKEIQALVIHELSGKNTIEEVKKGMDEAKILVNRSIEKYGSIHAIIDLCKCDDFSELNAHRLWAIRRENIFTNNQQITRIALIVQDNPNTQAEKIIMENQRIKFFCTVDDSIKWLQSK